MKTCLIRQPKGLGDVFFLQKVTRLYIELGWRVIFPVQSDYLWIADYIPDVNFVSEYEDFEFKEYYNKVDIIFTPDFHYLPLSHAEYLVHDFQTNMLMTCKYKLLNIDYNDWSDYLIFTRNIDKENNLFYNTLGLKDGEEYILINANFQSIGSVNKKNISVSTDLRKIEMNILEGYTLIDWCRVIENATELHFVDTSSSFIIEKLDLKAKIMRLYSRVSHFNTLDNTRMLYKKPWEYIN
jgi:hypothetical protein